MTADAPAASALAISPEVRIPPSAMTATFSAMVSGGYDFNLLVIDFPRNDRCTDADWWATINAYEAALKANQAKGGIVTRPTVALIGESGAEAVVPLGRGGGMGGVNVYITQPLGTPQQIGRVVLDAMRQAQGSGRAVINF